MPRPLQRHLRALLWLALALAGVIVLASATLRLSANGLGCAPWPACYGQAATAEAAQQTALVQTLRLAHRIAASSFVLVALAVVFLGWKRWPRSLRAVGVVLLLVTAVLAGIGRFTPSPLPLITLINVLGGLSLLLLLAWLLAGTSAATPVAAPEHVARFLRRVGIALLLVLAWQAASGAFISARLAGAACVNGCGEFWLPGAAALFNPFTAGSASELLGQPAAGQPLHLLHRVLGMALLVTTWAVALSWPRQQARRLRVLAWPLTAALLTGLIAASFDGSLAAGVAHVLLAGLTAAGAGTVLARNGQA